MRSADFEEIVERLERDFPHELEVCVELAKANGSLPLAEVREHAAKQPRLIDDPEREQIPRKCCNFENGDGGRPERSWAARFQAARSNSWSMN